MTLQPERSAWLRIGINLTALLFARGATSLPRERAWAADPASGALVVAGSGTSLDITRRLAEQFPRTRPDIRIAVPSGIGSGGATRPVAATGLGLVSRALKENKSRRGLTALPFSRSSVASTDLTAPVPVATLHCPPHLPGG